MPQYFLSGDDNGRRVRFELKPGDNVMGRSVDADCRLHDAAVSKRHAAVELQDSMVILKDMGSRNGTFVNDQRVDGTMTITNGDVIQIGNLRLTLDSGDSTSRAALSDDSMEVSHASFSTTIEEVREARGVSSSRLIQAVHEAGSMLSRRLKADEIYAFQLDLLGRFLPADRMLMLSGEIVEEGPEIVASRVRNMDPNAPIRMSQTMLAEVKEKSRSLLIQDVSAEERFAAQASIVAAGVHSAMAAPLFDNDKILGVVYVDILNPLVRFTEEDLQLLTLLANMMAVKITNSRLELVEGERERLRHELDLAARIQRNLLPDAPPALKDYDVYALQIPCHEVGGDLYDLREAKDGRIWLALGDVTGKGIGAAMLMADAMAGIQLLAQEYTEPEVLVRKLHDHIARHVEMGHYLTLFAAILDPATGEMEYVNAGHPSPLVLRGDRVDELESTGFPVALLPDATWPRTRTKLNSGDSIIIFSDAVTEATQGDLQYDEGRMQEFMPTLYGLDTKTAADKLLADLTEFSGQAEADDDLTLLMLRRTN